MSLNPVMLGVRFVLELCALASFAAYGWREFSSPWKWVLVVLLPVIAGAAWGTFAVPDDPSRNGKATVPVAGWVRFGVEFLVLWGGAAALWAGGLGKLALVSAAVLLVYYVLAWDRVVWLFSR
ncbi:YrdB family protein [Phytomonospora sp. NPDC050363]|uniref:YrdB family protein n=1 Tax=Phytomonospora sp. NPDC050363 TaxID=3155642 RepID=UPI0033BFE0D7